MRERILLALVATLVTWLLGAMPQVAADADAQEPGATARAELAITAARVADHPLVAIEVQVPPHLTDAAGDATAWTLQEEGDPRPIEVTGAADAPMSVVVLLDTSGSMRGEALAAATRAAADFAAGLPEHVAVGLLAFGDEPRVLAAPSTDRAALVAALGGLRARGETALYDAVLAGIDLVGQRPGRQRLVLLSDGGDTVSTATLADAVGAAEASGASLHALALATEESDAEILLSLAEATSGSAAAAADPTALAAIFDDLASALTSTTTVRFRSEVSTSATVRVVLDGGAIVGEGAVRLGYPASGGPAAPAAAASPLLLQRPDPTITVSLPTLLSQSWPIVVAIAAIGLALLIGGLAAFAMPSRASLVDGGRRARLPGVTGLADRAVGAAASRLRAVGADGALRARLRAAGLRLEPAEAIVLGLSVVGSALGLGWLMGRTVGALVMAGATIGVLLLIPSYAAARRRSAFDEQIGDVLQLLAGNLRAGFGLTQALASVSREADAPASEELERVVAEVRLGRDPGEALAEMAVRMDSVDLDWAVQAMAIHAEIGGDLARILDGVTATIRERARLRGQIRSLSAEGRLSAAILLLLPVVMTLFMRWRNPEYLAELVSGPVGFGMIGGAVLLLLLGGVWMANIVKVKF